MTKPQVRALAAEAGLPVASKIDSQDLCFLAGTTRARFLARHGGLGERRGAVIDRDGRVIGQHSGQHNFTVGQRRGLRLAGPEPLYVLDKDASANRVRVGPRAALRADRVTLRAVRLHRSGDQVDRVKLRYRTRPLPARLAGRLEAGRHAGAEIALGEPADAAAPGQLACLMHGDVVIGTGTISTRVP
jgi:tRNA-specific 2-thiouridylase